MIMTAMTQSWRSCGPELVQQMGQLSPFEAAAGVSEWRRRNLPLNQLLRSLWQFANLPRAHESEKMFHERMDAGTVILSAIRGDFTAGWPVASRLLHRVLAVLGTDLLMMSEPHSAAGTLREAWQAGRLGDAQIRTAEIVRATGPGTIIGHAMSASSPAPVLTFLPSLWRISLLLHNFWPPMDPDNGFCAATRAQASWMSSLQRMPDLLPAREASEYRPWNGSPYILDQVRAVKNKIRLPADVFACYQNPDGAGALVHQLARCSAPVSTRRLTSLLVDTCAFSVAQGEVTNTALLSRHILALMDWLALARFAGSDSEERAAVWTAWGWYFAIALAWMSGDGTVGESGARPFDEEDERRLWNAVRDGRADEAVAVAFRLGDIGEIWADIEDDAMVSACPAALRMVSAFKPWVHAYAFRNALLPAVVRIMAQSRAMIFIYDAE
jgi:hypothetical protein